MNRLGMTLALSMFSSGLIAGEVSGVIENPPPQTSETSSPQYAEASPSSAIRWSAGVESGVHYFDTTNLGIEKLSKDYVDLLRSLGWSNATETHALNISNMYEGLFVNVDIAPMVSVGGGWRYFNLGNGQIDVEGSSNTPFSQYSRITDTYSVSAQTFYVKAGLYEYVSPKLKVSIGLESGLVFSTSEDNFSWKTYNGSYFDDHQKVVSDGTGIQYTATFSAEYMFTSHFNASIDLGYKYFRIKDYKVKSVDSTLGSSPSVGDTLKDSNNADYSINMDGFIGGVKVAFVY